MAAALIDVKWGWIAVRGVLAVLFGLLALFRPGLTLTTLILVFGVYAMADGVSMLITAISNRRSEPNWVLHVIGGVALIILGMLVLATPGITAIVLLYYVAAWAIVAGIMEIIAGIRLRKLIQNEWVYVLAGGVSLAFGLFLITRPGLGTRVLMAWLGVYALVLGMLLIFLAFKLRNWTRMVPKPAESA